MAIVGGALMPPLQGSIIDLGTVAGLPAVNFSFILPLVCFAVVATYGWRIYGMYQKSNKKQKYEVSQNWYPPHLRRSSGR